MCLQFLPMLALTAAGTGAQIAGRQRAQSAMNDATIQELARQRAIQGQASQEFQQSIGQSAKPVADRQMQEGAQEKQSGYEQLQSVPLNTGNQQLVGGQGAAMNLQDAAQRSLSNRTRAKLGSYDKWQLDQAVKNLRSAQQQSLYNQQAQRSQAILPLELQDASHRGDMLQGIGMGLTSLGSLAGVMGAGGAFGGLGGGAASGGGHLLLSPAQQAMMVGSPVGAATPGLNVAAGFGQGTLFPSLGGIGSGMGGLYGLTPRF